MDIKSILQKERYKFLIITVLLVISCFLTYYFHFVIKTGVIFTHFFYIPIVLATIWWRYRGLIVPVFLSIMLILSHSISGGMNVSLTDDYIRTAMFLIIGLVVAYLSERIKKTERILTESEEKYRSVIESANEAIITADSNGDITSWNKGAQQIFGYEMEEILGKSVGTMIPSRYRNAFHEGLDNYGPVTSREFKDENIELIALRTDGTEFPFEISGSRWETDDQTYFTVIIRDVTERRKARETKNKLAAIVEYSDDAIIGVDLNGMITSWNRGAEIIYGYSAHEVMGKSISILIPDKCHDDLTKILDDTKKGKKIDHYETPCQKKSGEIIDISLTISPIRDMENKVTGASTIGRDITEQKRMERALKDSEEKFRNIFNSANDSIFLHEISDDGVPGKFIEINEVACTIFGYTRDEFLNMTPKDLVSPQEKNDVYKRGEKLIENGHNTFQTVDMTKDGLEIPMEVNSHLINLKGKNLILSVSRDITERKKAEKALKQSITEKEMLIREIHHRVKNNLMVISSLLNLQSRYIKDKESFNIFRESQNRAKSMALIHERLYRSDNMKKINFGEYIETLSTDLYRTYVMDQDLIRLNLDVENAEIDINTSVPLGLIVNELVSNSMKHAFPDERRGEINISFKKVDDSFVLSVNDDGIGFQQDFDFKNTGSLGLQLVNMLVGQIKGKIELKNKKGTEFKITFKELYSE